MGEGGGKGPRRREGEGARRESTAYAIYPQSWYMKGQPPEAFPTLELWQRLPACVSSRVVHNERKHAIIGSDSSQNESAEQSGVDFDQERGNTGSPGQTGMQLSAVQVYTRLQKSSATKAKKKTTPQTNQSNQNEPTADAITYPFFFFFYNNVL